jgi:hypothetical protein
MTFAHPAKKNNTPNDNRINVAATRAWLPASFM